jgi:homocitrate synthase NifV
MSSTKRNSTCPFVDTTLRDGEQAPDVVFTKAERTSIFTALVDIGVREIELSALRLVSSDFIDVDVVGDHQTHQGANVIAWCRARADDVEAALDSLANAIHIGIPTSSTQLAAVGMKPADVFRRLSILLHMIQSGGRKTFLGAQDATRADPAFLSRVILEAIKGGASRIRIADTVGVAHPEMVARMVRHLRSQFSTVEFEFHAHNDFGMATANAIAAIQAGAHYVSTTVLGIGERAGNAPFEITVTAAEKLLNQNTGIDLSKLSSLCHLVAKASGREIDSCRPIVGRQVFTHESGVHTHGQLFNTECFEPLSASLVGHSPSQFLFGKNTGKASVRRLLSDIGLVLSENKIERITQNIRQSAAATKSVFTKQGVIDRLQEFIR